MTNSKGSDSMKDSIIVCLIGAQGSGKSTVEKWVNEELNIPRLISHTTRPQRVGERDDEYHFVTLDEFEILRDGFIETRAYNVANGETWWYGVHEDAVIAPVHIVVVDYEGFTEIREQHNVIGIHLDISKETSYRRVLENRPDYSREECERRFASDVVDIQDPARDDHLIIQIDSEQDLNETLREVKNYIKLAQSGLNEQDLFECWVEERLWEVGCMVGNMKKVLE